MPIGLLRGSDRSYGATYLIGASPSYVILRRQTPPYVLHAWHCAAFVFPELRDTFVTPPSDI